MRRTPQEFDAAYALKKEALGPHVIPRWGWDDARQRAIMEEKWRVKTFHRIVVEGETVGTISIDADGDGIEIGEFYIAPAFQGRGIGSAVLGKVLDDAAGKAVRLRVLKWNPAVALYARHGFAVVGETDVHYLMEHAPRR
jgi:ribosomal protein S18 acetylase RimI-like enzyme